MTFYLKLAPHIAALQHWSLPLHPLPCRRWQPHPSRCLAELSLPQSHHIPTWLCLHSEHQSSPPSTPLLCASLPSHSLPVSAGPVQHLPHGSPLAFFPYSLFPTLPPERPLQSRSEQATVLPSHCPSHVGTLRNSFTFIIPQGFL